MLIFVCAQVTSAATDNVLAFCVKVEECFVCTC